MAPASPSPSTTSTRDRSLRWPSASGDEHGHIDLLVNDIWGAELLKGGPADWDTPIWELDLDTGLRILRLAIDTHLITSHHLLPLMVDRPGGLVVEVTDGTDDYNATRYRISVFYDLAKVAVNRLAFSQGHELEPLGCTAVALTPGWLRSEIMLEAFADDRGELARGDRGAARLRALGVAAVRRTCRRRPRVGSRPVPLEPAVGQLRAARREYGFTDVDGSQPQIWDVIAAQDPT